MTLAILADSAAILANAEIGPREPSSLSVFAVTIRHHGVDAREMERSIAMPLEDALASIPGSKETSSVSEYGKTSVLVGFALGTDGSDAYEAVRDAAQRVCDRLPRSVQRPEIRSRSEGRNPAWVAAVRADGCPESSLGRVLERSVKPALERLAGAGDVELAGSGRPELVVEVDEEAAASAGVSILDIASSLAGSDLLAPAGSLRLSGITLGLVADGRLPTAESINGAYVATGSGEPVPLGAFCRVSAQDRKAEALSRVDGEPAATISVSPGGGSSLPALSRAIARESAILSAEHGIRFTVLSDTGAEVAASFMSTLSATVQGVVAVAVASALLVGAGGSSAWKARLVAVAAVPVILVMSAATMSSFGIGFDRHALAGLAVGLGSAVDSVLLASERLGGSVSPEAGKTAMRKLAPSLAAGLATTLAVLVPLAGLDFLSEGVASIAGAIASVCVVSWLATVLLMPPLVLGSGVSPVALSRRCPRAARRLLAMNARLCTERPGIPLAAAALLGIAGIVAVVVSPIDTSAAWDENVVYVHVEFEPGAAIDSVDKRLAGYAVALRSREGVTCVQSTARQGSGSVLAAFDPSSTSRDRVAEAARNIEVPGGFAWVPEPSVKERSWRLSVFGDDDAVCRRLAIDVSAAVSRLPFVIEAVLNFKDGAPGVALRPDRERAAALGIDFSSAADAVRRAVYGPVAYKRIDNGVETDVRVTALGKAPPVVGDILSTLLLSSAGPVRVDAIMTPYRGQDVSRIQRLDRRRVASITMRSRMVDPRSARDAVDTAVADLRLPPGYSLEFDRDAMQVAERLGGVGSTFILAVVLSYMATAALTESFGVPLLVMSTLPPSLAVPALILAAAGVPLDAASACAFVAVSGMAVNASVLVVNERRSRLDDAGRAGAADLYAVTRARLGSLAATCGTTVAGALPFLFLRGTDGALVRSLAFVAAAGTFASFFMALCMIPALARAAPRLFHSISYPEPGYRKGTER
jgi:multidrug efflux pump subunit AcrB